jgi:Reverse transcriptase (RNA-dependent DNA polymerase)
MSEVTCIGGGIGGGFVNTNELQAMKYQQAMETEDKEQWTLAVKEEHASSVLKSAKIITSTWAKKKKSNGVFCARLAARGFQQQDGVHYDSSNTSSPVVNDITIRIFFVLAIMAGWKLKCLMSWGHSCMVSLRMVKKSTWTFHKGLNDSMKLTQF